MKTTNKNKGKKKQIDLRRNDLVQIIAGDHRGTIAKIMNVNRTTGKVQVEGVSKHVRFTKKTAQHPYKSMVMQEGLIDRSNVKKVETNDQTTTN
jgi:large subunit ribosomal protein L24